MKGQKGIEGREGKPGLNGLTGSRGPQGPQVCMYLITACCIYSPPGEENLESVLACSIANKQP